MAQARNGFDLDLLDGVAREDAFARLLTSARFEHKRDFAAERTGNFAVEWETSELPNGEGRVWLSGISTTTSEWWVTEYADNCRDIKPTALVKTAARDAIRRGRVVWGADDNRFHLALVAFR